MKKKKKNAKVKKALSVGLMASAAVASSSAATSTVAMASTLDTVDTSVSVEAEMVSADNQKEQADDLGKAKAQGEISQESQESQVEISQESQDIEIAVVDITPYITVDSRGLITEFKESAKDEVEGKAILIPAEKDGIVITGIADGSWNKSVFMEMGMTEVYFAEGSQLKTIGKYAFKGCEALTNIALPSTVISIGNSAFKQCESLSNIELSNSLITIGDSAFFGCSSLTEVTVPKAVTSIGDSAFAYCTNLVDISLPTGLTKINEGTFSNCVSLESIVLPYGVESIESGAFVQCSSLSHIELPSTLNKMIDADVVIFYGCDSLTSIYIDNYEDNISRNLKFEIENIEGSGDVTLYYKGDIF